MEENETLERVENEWRAPVTNKVYYKSPLLRDHGLVR